MISWKRTSVNQDDDKAGDYSHLTSNLCEGYPGWLVYGVACLGATCFIHHLTLAQRYCFYIQPSASIGLLLTAIMILRPRQTYHILCIQRCTHDWCGPTGLNIPNRQQVAQRTKKRVVLRASTLDIDPASLVVTHLQVDEFQEALDGVGARNVFQKS